MHNLCMSYSNHGTFFANKISETIKSGIVGKVRPQVVQVQLWTPTRNLKDNKWRARRKKIIIRFRKASESVFFWNLIWLPVADAADVRHNSTRRSTHPCSHRHSSSLLPSDEKKPFLHLQRDAAGSGDCVRYCIRVRHCHQVSYETC